jgi:hypothetical protein
LLSAVRNQGALRRSAAGKAKTKDKGIAVEEKDNAQ